jgi:biopolymer transport protein ExbD
MRKHISSVRMQDDENEINLTPMLDVVFIMLIFFIVTAVFVREPGTEVERPEAVTVVPGTASIFVAITANNEIWIDGRQIDQDGVRSAVERLHSENPEGGIIIQADAAAENGTLIAVMDASKAAGVNEILLAAQEP